MKVGFDEGWKKRRKGGRGKKEKGAGGRGKSRIKKGRG